MDFGALEVAIFHFVNPTQTRWLSALRRLVHVLIAAVFNFILEFVQLPLVWLVYNDARHFERRQTRAIV